MTLVLLPLAADAEPDPAHYAEASPWLRPAPCPPARAADMLALLADDYLTTQVFLDFGRLFRPGRARPGLTERIFLVDLERHTRFLPASLARIGAAFAAAGGVGPLFLLTGDGALLLHRATRFAIATLCTAGGGRPAPDSAQSCHPRRSFASH
jgi:hypothetical protein